MSVYFVHAPETGLVKIGFAENPIARLGKMQVDSPSRLILLAIEHGGKAREAQLHEQFTDLRARGEWFRFAEGLAEYVGTLPPFVKPQAARKIGGPLGCWMVANGHTLATFANLIGTTEASLSRVCSGKQLPRRDLLLRIVEATDWEVDANALLGVPPRPTKADAA